MIRRGTVFLFRTSSPRVRIQQFSTSLRALNKNTDLKITPQKNIESKEQFSTTTSLESDEEIKANSSKLIDEIQEQKRKLDQQSATDSSPSIKSTTEFINTIVNSQNFQNLKNELAKYNEKREKITKNYSESLSEKIKLNVKELRKSISILSKVVNDITGYSKINTLKEDIASKEVALTELRKTLLVAKEDYSNAILNRANSQKTVNELLERKHRWTPDDLEEFTNLYKNDHILEKRVQDTAAEVKEIEAKEDSTYKDLVQSIMTRYHEEQLWSDKIRQFSTWGTLLIMAVNLVVVLVVQLILEPWKRSRLVSSFEYKVKELFDKEETFKELESFKQELKDDVIVLQSTSLEKPCFVSLFPTVYTFEGIKQWFKHLFSEILIKPFSSVDKSSVMFLTVDKVELNYFLGFATLLGILLGKLF